MHAREKRQQQEMAHADGAWPMRRPAAQARVAAWAGAASIWLWGRSLHYNRWRTLEQGRGRLQRPGRKKAPDVNQGLETTI